MIKKLLLISCMLLGVLEGMAQEPWSLKLELVNPTGKLDDRSYFLATLREVGRPVLFFGNVEK